MRDLFLILNLILSMLIFSCNNKKNEKNEMKNPQIKKIELLLEKQKECWNSGDIYGFMQGYWQSEKLIFTSENHKPVYGWNNTLERYKKSYPNKESMGKLKFEWLDIQINSDSSSGEIKGYWELIRDNDNPNGEFFIKLRKIENQWKIVKDSTTSN